MATFAKLKSGEWGLRGTPEELQAGRTVQVTKRSGETQLCTVGKVLWTGNGVALATISGAGDVRSGRQRRAGGAVCAECGRPGRLVEDLEDGMLKHYNCCDIPPGGY